MTPARRSQLWYPCFLLLVAIALRGGNECRGDVVMNWGYLTIEGNAYNSNPWGNFGYNHVRHVEAGSDSLSWQTWAGNGNVNLAPAYSYADAGVDWQPDFLRSDSRSYVRYQAGDQTVSGSSWSSSGSTLLFTATSSFLGDVSFQFNNRLDIGGSGITQGHSWAYLYDHTIDDYLFSHFEEALNGVSTDKSYFMPGIRLNANHIYSLVTSNFSSTSSNSGTDFTLADHYSSISLGNFQAIPEPTNFAIFGGLLLMAVGSLRRRRVVIRDGYLIPHAPIPHTPRANLTAVGVPAEIH